TRHREQSVALHTRLGVAIPPLTKSPSRSGLRTAEQLLQEITDTRRKLCHRLRNKLYRSVLKFLGGKRRCGCFLNCRHSQRGDPIRICINNRKELIRGNENDVAEPTYACDINRRAVFQILGDDEISPSSGRRSP